MLPCWQVEAYQNPVLQVRVLWHLRSTVPALFFIGVVEREGRYPQGAVVRPDKPGRESWRGCEGVLLLPRQYANAFLHALSLQVSAQCLSLR